MSFSNRPHPVLVHHRIGGWLPRDHRVLERWLSRIITDVESKGSVSLDPVIRDFQRVIEEDPVIYMGFHQMFEQIPNKPPYNETPDGKPQVRDYKLMLRLFNHIIKRSPEYENNDLVGFPINAILDWPMGTEAGVATFMIPKVNAQFHKMFDVWSAFLTSPDSRYVLRGGSANAWIENIPNFVETYVCDPSDEYYGFKSWDDFFIRHFRDGLRPVTFPDNDAIVNSACESAVFAKSFNVKARDEFWLKNQPYSLDYMLNNDPLTEKFIGGTVYQAFLSALKYHRWHSPVNGRIVKTVMIPGTYYAESPAMGFESGDPDKAAPNNSQSFITAIAARALIFMESNNPAIGLMCFMAVGMAEVSTCEITVAEGDTVRKGDQLGMFHFGGSTHCLIFRPETSITFASDYGINDDVPLNAAIATVA